MYRTPSLIAYNTTGMMHLKLIVAWLFKLHILVWQIEDQRLQVEKYEAFSALYLFLLLYFDLLVSFTNFDTFF
jgi:hypothetical protein